MPALAQHVGASRQPSRAPAQSLLFVLLAIILPVLAGLAWHQASDNPLWPVVRNSLTLCQLRDAQLSPLSPDGFYRAHVVHVSCFGRFDETLVFVTSAAEPWSLQNLKPEQAILEAAGVRALDALSWREAPDATAPILQLWLTPDAARTQVHRVQHLSGPIVIETFTSTPPPGSERLD